MHCLGIIRPMADISYCRSHEPLLGFKGRELQTQNQIEKQHAVTFFRLGGKKSPKTMRAIHLTGLTVLNGAGFNQKCLNSFDQRDDDVWSQC